MYYVLSIVKYGKIMSEYLSHFGKDALNLPGWQEILETGEPVDRKSLLDFLTGAKEFLISEPGPHLAERQAFSYDWLRWWTAYINNKKADQRPALLLPLAHIRRYKDPDIRCGVLFAGGMEGHRGHRNAINWMLSFVEPIILLEQDEYLASKERKAPFLPLNVRLSMWSFYSPHLIISALPKRNPEVSEKDHYQAIFNATQAEYCFAAEGDPNREEKRARGKAAGFTLIPYTPTAPTTFRVQKLDSEPSESDDFLSVLK